MAYFKENVIKQNMFPVGYVMITTNDTNPSAQFGGTWINIGSGKTLVGVDTEDSDYNTVEKTGGSKTKTLITDNLPAHNHTASSSSSFEGNTATGSLSLLNEHVAWLATFGRISGVFKKAGTTSSYQQGTVTQTTIDSTASATVDFSMKPSGTVTTTTTTSNTGSGTAFDVKNPYLTVYFWKKTA